MTINEALNIIHDENSSEDRRSAFEFIIISKLYNEDIIHILASGLVDEDRGVRDICSRGLSNIPSEFANYVAFMVVPLIAHNDIEIRNLAGDLLLNLKEKSIDALLPFLENASVDVRKYACDILGIVGSINNLYNIYPLLSDLDINVRNSGIEAIGNIIYGNEADTSVKIEALDKLIISFEIDSDSHPNILDSIGKIGGLDSENFLINYLQNIDDEFLKIACIDSLAIAGNSKELCIKLLEELPYNSSELQVVMLKTIYAILFRIDEMIDLPADLRYIAHNALIDDDSDIRGAGLLALGSIYYPEDSATLVNELIQNNTGTTQYLMYNLMSQSPVESVESLFKEFLHRINKENTVGKIIDLLGVSSVVWEAAEKENIEKVYEIIIDYVLDSAIGTEFEVIELLIHIEPIVTNKTLIEKMRSAEKEKQLVIYDIIKEFQLDDIMIEAENIINSD